MCPECGRTHGACPGHPERSSYSLLERIAQAAQEGAAAAEWNGELLATLLDEVRALSLLVQAPSRSAPGAAAAELPDRGSYAYQRAAESGPPYGQLTRAEQRAGDQVGDRACQPDHYQARLGRLSDQELDREVSRGRQAEREQRHRQQMREAGVQQKPAKSST